MSTADAVPQFHAIFQVFLELWSMLTEDTVVLHNDLQSDTGSLRIVELFVENM